MRKTNNSQRERLRRGTPRRNCGPDLPLPGSTLIEHAPMGVYVVDHQFCLQKVNSRALPVFKSVTPLRGRDFSEVMRIIWGAELGGRLSAIFRHTLHTGERYDPPPFLEQRGDLDVQESYEWGTQRVTLPDGQHGVVCYSINVTERHRAEATLRERHTSASPRRCCGLDLRRCGFYEQ